MLCKTPQDKAFKKPNAAMQSLLARLLETDFKVETLRLELLDDGQVDIYWDGEHRLTLKATDHLIVSTEHDHAGAWETGESGSPMAVQFNRESP